MEAQTRFEEAQQRSAPKSRICFICGEQIIDPDDYLGLGYLIDDRNHPLHRFNYAHFHRSCLKKWPGARNLAADLEKLDESGEWQGEGLKQLIRQIRTAVS
jgi:hypothetical protein